MSLGGSFPGIGTNAPSFSLAPVMAQNGALEAPAEGEVKNQSNPSNTVAGRSAKFPAGADYPSLSGSREYMDSIAWRRSSRI